MKMKAVAYYKYGPPEVLSLVELPKPSPKANEVLVKIHCSTVNRTDTGIRMAEYLIGRFVFGLFKPKQHVLGSEFSGTIESIGNDIKNYKVGDRVFGLSTYKFGCHAEYICLKEDASMAIIPNNYSFEEAACVLDGLMLAQNYIKEIDFSKNPRIMINGATGSIGIACLQLAAMHNVYIAAVGDTKNLELLKSLGATKVIDYTKSDFCNDNEKYDYIIDAVGKSTFAKSKKIMKEKAVYYSTELGPYWQNTYLPLFTMFSAKKIKFPIPVDNKALIEKFAGIIASGKYKAIIDSEYTLDNIAEAHRYVEKAVKTGNVLVRVII